MKDNVKTMIQYISWKTWFNLEILEKDYYISILLNEFSKNPFLKNTLIFKGWTSLSKFYLNYYRMSEDLDFTIDYKKIDNEYKTATKTHQAKIRSKYFSKVIEEIVKLINEKFSDIFFIIQEEISKETNELPEYKHNSSSFVRMNIGYNSVFTQKKDLPQTDYNNHQIIIEILFSDIIFPPVTIENSHILKMNGIDVLPVFELQLLNLKQIICDKFCAMTDRTYSKRRIAIRDFYDIKFLLNEMWCDFKELYPSIVEIYKLDASKKRELLDLTYDKEFIINSINEQKNLLLNTTWEKWNLFFNEKEFNDFYNKIINIQNDIKEYLGFPKTTHIKDCIKIEDD